MLSTASSKLLRLSLQISSFVSDGGPRKEMQYLDELMGMRLKEAYCSQPLLFPLKNWLPYIIPVIAIEREAEHICSVTTDNYMEAACRLPLCWYVISVMYWSTYQCPCTWEYSGLWPYPCLWGNMPGISCSPLWTETLVRFQWFHRGSFLNRCVWSFRILTSKYSGQKRAYFYPMILTQIYSQSDLPWNTKLSAGWISDHRIR